MAVVVDLHILDRETSIQAVRKPTGRLSVDIEADDLRITIACDSTINEKGLFSEPLRLADQLEAAAKSLRVLAAPEDAGDHFVRTVA